MSVKCALEILEKNGHIKMTEKSEQIYFWEIFTKDNCATPDKKNPEVFIKYNVIKISPCEKGYFSTMLIEKMRTNGYKYYKRGSDIYFWNPTELLKEIKEKRNKTEFFIIQEPSSSEIKSMLEDEYKIDMIGVYYTIIGKKWLLKLQDLEMKKEREKQEEKSLQESLDLLEKLF